MRIAAPERAECLSNVELETREHIPPPAFCSPQHGQSAPTNSAAINALRERAPGQHLLDSWLAEKALAEKWLCLELIAGGGAWHEIALDARG